MPAVKPRVMAIVGARPNFMKVAPIWRELEKGGTFDLCLCHTGQHYDDNMSKVFFDDLKLPRPDVYLGVGSGSQGEQTGRIMVAFEEVLREHTPDLLVVVGDVNSTMACTLNAVKSGIPVAHVEAGLRSFDRGMPEEINRMVTDILCDLLFTTSPEAHTNLVREGVDEAKIHFVGNVMIDSLRFYADAAAASTVLEDLGIEEGKYGLVTLHRPSNVDDPEVLGSILDALLDVGAECPLLFPVHPRTAKMIESRGVGIDSTRLRLIGPVGYLDFAKLTRHTRIVLTDSGGIQEETTVLGIPCITIRENTERPITCTVGTNVMVGIDPDRIRSEARRMLRDGPGEWQIPELWDGQAARRIVEIIEAFLR